jgi:hypothetical protein
MDLRDIREIDRKRQSIFSSLASDCIELCTLERYNSWRRKTNEHDSKPINQNVKGH